MSGQKKKFLFFYLKTGGGHLAPARSIANYIQKNYPDINPLLVDGFTKTNRVVKYLIEDGYRNLQTKAKWYYELLYAVNKVAFFARFNTFVLSISTKKYVKEMILTEKPEKIVILHFFLIQPVYEVLKENNLNIPVVTVITDPYTAHKMWFLTKGQHYVVFSKRLEEYIQKRLPDAGTKVFPFVLDEKFSSPLPFERIKALKNELGFRQDKKIVLVMGGGDGIPHGRKILCGLLEANIDAQIIVVCGRNESLYKTAMQLKRQYNADNLTVYGFVNNVYELLNICDVVLTKCGASTMMEILMLKKVPVVNDYIWEQEKGNIEFIVHNKLGLYEPVIRKIPAIINTLITDEKEYCFYKDNIENMRLQNGTPLVGDYLAK